MYFDLLSLLKRCVCPAEHFNKFKDMVNTADALISNGFGPLTEVSMCIAIVFFGHHFSLSKEEVVKKKNNLLFQNSDSFLFFVYFDRNSQKNV